MVQVPAMFWSRGALCRFKIGILFSCTSPTFLFWIVSALQVAFVALWRHPQLGTAWQEWAYVLLKALSRLWAPRNKTKPSHQKLL